MIRALDAKFIKGELSYEVYIKFRTEYHIEHENKSKGGCRGLDLDDVTIDRYTPQIDRYTLSLGPGSASGGHSPNLEENIIDNLSEILRVL